MITIPKDVMKDIISGKYRDCYLVGNRKSTDEPNNQKNSITYQRTQNLRYAKNQKPLLRIAPLTIEGFCRDGIVSERHSAFKENSDIIFGQNNTVQFQVERPKFFKMAELVSKGYFKGIIFLCWDRASRNKADDVILRKLMKSGADIRFTLAEYDKTSSGELHMDVEGMFAAHHSRVTSEKVKLAVEEKRNLGVWTHKAPVGFLNEGNMDHKPHDPKRAPLILRFFELANEGWSLASIARWAVEQGFTMPPVRRRRTDEEILAEEEDDIRLEIEAIERLPTANSIHKILMNRFYTGMVLTTDGQWVPSKSHEKIVDTNLFESVQQRLNEKNKSAHYEKVLDYPCRKIIRCGACNRVYTPYEQKETIYYGARCRAGCANPTKSFNFDFIADKVGELIGTLSFTKKELEELDARTSTEIAILETKRLSQIEASDRRKRAIREQLAFLDAHRTELLTAGAYTPGSFVLEQKKLEKELADLQSKEQVSDEAMRETVREIIKLSELLIDGLIYYSLANPEEKDAAIRVIFSELTINGETLQYKCRNGFKALSSRFIPNCDPTGNRTPISRMKT